MKRRRRATDKMGEYDRLTPELRAWLSSAMLPWRPKSVQRAYRAAYAKIGDAAGALKELDRMQKRLVAKDAQRIWGPEHPDARFDRG